MRQDIQRRDGGGGIRRRQPDAENQAGAQKAHIFDQPGIAGDIAAAAGQRLAQGAHVDINAAGRQAEGFAHAAAGGADIAQRMGLIHHQQKIMTFLGLNGAGQIQDLAIHAVHALAHQQAAAEIAALLLHDAVEFIPIAILLGIGLGARQLGAEHVGGGHAHVAERHFGSAVGHAVEAEHRQRTLKASTD